MNKIIPITILLLFSNLFAQTDETKVKLGVGVTFGKDIIYQTSGIPLELPSFGTIYFPIDIYSNFRIEPEIAYYSKSVNISSNSIIKTGVGLFKVFSYSNSNILLGGRIGFIYNLIKNENTGDHSEIDYFYGLSAGGEYYFSNHISVGGEAQINNILRSSYDENEDDFKSLFNTRGLFVLRFYFN